MKALRLLLEKGGIGVDVILIIDEMYLQRSCEYRVMFIPEWAKSAFLKHFTPSTFSDT